MRRSIIALAATFAALLAAPLAAQDFPALTGRVVDEAGIIDAATEAELTQKLESLEAQSQRQLVVVTIPDLQGQVIEDYGYRLGREWGIGEAERNDGALLIVAPNERKVRIEVGYGLEGYLTDAYSSVIIQNAILPRAREGDLQGGIVAGTDAIITQLQLPEDQARQVASQATKTRERSGGIPLGLIFWGAIILFYFILPMMRGRRRRYRGRGRDFGDTVSDIILWEVGSAIVRGAMSGGGGSSGGGGFGGGFGGGGGFSGGGGSFGGGGASGGW